VTAIPSSSARSGAGEIQFAGRRALALENEDLRVIMTLEGCNIAAIEHRASGLNPLWTPPWPSLEPSAFRQDLDDYGNHQESKVLASIQGHSICLDTYGGPSPEEAAAAMPIHGEAMFLPYETTRRGDSLTFTSTLPMAQIRWSRTVALAGSNTVRIAENVDNLSACDRPIAWTQHVTLGPPFLERGTTQFHAGVTRSKVIDADFGGAQERAAEFEWPHCPRKGGGTIDLRLYSNEIPSGGFTTHLVDPSSAHGYWIAWSPGSRVYFGYVWKRDDFPFLCRWEENQLRTVAPWNGRTLTCGMEISASPMVESRRDMVTRGGMFGAPGYKWLPAKGRLETRYAAFLGESDALPRAVEWDGADQVKISI
jgi:hypothetical protein